MPICCHRAGKKPGNHKFPGPACRKRPMAFFDKEDSCKPAHRSPACRVSLRRHMSASVTDFAFFCRRGGKTLRGFFGFVRFFDSLKPPAMPAVQLVRKLARLIAAVVGIPHEPWSAVSPAISWMGSYCFLPADIYREFHRVSPIRAFRAVPMRFILLVRQTAPASAAFKGTVPKKDPRGGQ